LTIFDDVCYYRNILNFRRQMNEPIAHKPSLHNFGVLRIYSGIERQQPLFPAVLFVRRAAETQGFCGEHDVGS
jgi:hypothetical protein